MYTHIHKSHLANKRILPLVRKLKFLEMKAALMQDIFFGSKINAFKKFHK